MSKFLDIPSAIGGSTVYTNGTLVGRNVNVTLPEVSAVMADVTANGTFSVPITAWWDNMELTINLNGIPKESAALLARPEAQQIEVRLAQDMVMVDHTTRTIGIKAFLRAVPQNFPGFDVTIGESGENEMRFSVSRYELMIDNEKQCCFDRINNICEILGTNYADTIEPLL